jgi:hypothetical protein
VDVRCRVSGVRKKTWKLKLETMIRSFINSLGMMYEMRDDGGTGRNGEMGIRGQKLEDKGQTIDIRGHV